MLNHGQDVEGQRRRAPVSAPAVERLCVAAGLRAPVQERIAEKAEVPDAWRSWA
jgi:hypothetical protein